MFGGLLGGAAGWAAGASMASIRVELHWLLSSWVSSSMSFQSDQWGKSASLNFLVLLAFRSSQTPPGCPGTTTLRQWAASLGSGSLPSLRPKRSSSYQPLGLLVAWALALRRP
ncbi:hypothetical protein D3C72_1457690 [compost metagenome]